MPIPALSFGYIARNSPSNEYWTESYKVTTIW